jgi:hypothetical protein
MWTLAFGHHEDRTPTHGYDPTREAAIGSIRQEAGGGSRRHDKPRRRAGPVSGAGMGHHLHHPAGRGGGHICTCPYSLEREAAMAAFAKSWRRE